MNQYTADQIIEGIRERDIDVLNHLYKAFYKDIRQFIKNNNGKEEDAKDIFQESIIVIFRQLETKNLVLTCNFKTYLYSICRNLWFKQLERKNLAANYQKEKFHHQDGWNEDLEELMSKNERYTLFHKHFQQLTDNCKKILKLFFDGNSLKNIASLLGYASENYVKKRKYQCKENLIHRIQNDPNYKELL